MKKTKKSFLELVKNAKKILILDLGFLGDTVQLIPAINAIREALPNATIDVMVSEHIKFVLELIPAVDNILGYPRFPKGPKWYQDIGRVMKLRKKNYDAIINLNGSDRSSLLTWAIGAPLRLGRIQKVLRPFTPFCFTHITFFPFDSIPVHQQHLNCLEYSGFPHAKPCFNAIIPNDVEKKIAQTLNHESDYIHVAPFASQVSRELSVELLAEFLNHIHQNYPEKKISISSSSNKREIDKLNLLLKNLNFEPWKIFAGTISIIELTAILERAAILISADSGPMHLSVMVNTPTFIWCRDDHDVIAWRPSGPHHRYVSGRETSQGLENISLSQLTSAFDKLFHSKAFT